MIRLIQKQWLGQDIVAWCDNEGTICVAQSVCPHLGSSLGPAAGGRVRDGHLVCPFHGFTYDVTGNCVATPYAEPPASVRLKVFDTREILGLVFAWWGIDGRPPQWDLPKEPSAGGEWSDLELRTLRFPGHPQETTENSVDLAHLRHVHGYDDVKAAGSTTADGALLVSRFDFRSRRRIAGFTDIIYDFSVTAYVHGLGYSFVDIHERTIGIDSRMWILATPVDGTLHRSGSGRTGPGNTKAQTPDRRPRILTGEVTHQFHEQDLDSYAKAGCSPGCRDLGTEELPASSAFVPLRRCHRQISALLQTVLSAWRQ